MEKKGSKMKVSFEWREGRDDHFTTVFYHENNRISEYKMETVKKIWTEA